MPLTKSDQARLNGAKSKGPISIDGKRRSAQNSTRHCLVADKVVVLQNEMPEAFDRVYNAFAKIELVLPSAVARRLPAS